MPCSSRHPYHLSDAERQMLQGTWPLELIEDPARQPRIIETAHEFVRELLTGDHLEDFLILPNGTELLDLSWEDTMPHDLQGMLKDCRSARDFAMQLRRSPEALEKYRADVEYLDIGRQQRDVLRKDKHDLGKRIDEALRMVDEEQVDADLLYVAEMRLKKEIPHPIGGDKAKTVCRRDMKDVLGPYAAWTLYWDRYDEGFFAGGRNSGKGVHVDQVLWSNVGRNWRGHKLVAAWPKGEVSKRTALEFYDVLFTPPLKESELRALQQAAKVVLLRPGDVYIFSGGIAHTVLCVSEEMCLGAYESFISLNPAHVEHFMHTDDQEGPFCLDKYAMPSKELKDTKDDCIDQLEDVEEQLSQGGPAASIRRTGPLPAMWESLLARLHGDAELQSSLRRAYAQVVELCITDRYFRRHLPHKVLAAGQACGGRGLQELAARREAKRRRGLPPETGDGTLLPTYADACGSSGTDSSSHDSSSYSE